MRVRARVYTLHVCTLARVFISGGLYKLQHAKRKIYLSTFSSNLKHRRMHCTTQRVSTTSREKRAYKSAASMDGLWETFLTTIKVGQEGLLLKSCKVTINITLHRPQFNCSTIIKYLYFLDSIDFYGMQGGRAWDHDNRIFFNIKL